MRIVGIVQGRMASSRLPGKILKKISGQPMLAQVVERARQATLIDEVGVATTTDPSDDAVERFCQKRGYPVYRGSLLDVLDRFYQAAKMMHADAVVRFTADCPLLDPSLVDETIRAFMQQKADFAANRLPPPFKRTYPIGLDTEVCSFAALERAWREATEKHDREHVLPYLYEVEGRFKVVVLNFERDYGHYRWTVDTPEDLRLVRRIFRRMAGQPGFTWLDVVALFDREPQLVQLNAGVQHKTMFDVDDRFKKG